MQISYPENRYVNNSKLCKGSTLFWIIKINENDHTTNIQHCRNQIKNICFSNLLQVSDFLERIPNDKSTCVDTATGDWW